MTTASSTAESRRRLLELIQGYRVTQVLYAAVSLGVAEALSGRARNSHDLAAAVGAPETYLVRLLRPLISLGLIGQDSDGRYTLTEAGTLLDGQSLGSVRAGILFEGAVLYQHWSDLLDSIRTGQNLYQRRYGVDAWRPRRAGQGAASRHREPGHARTVPRSLVASPSSVTCRRRVGFHRAGTRASSSRRFTR